MPQYEVHAVCEPCRRNGSMEHRATVCHLFCVQLSDSATTTHGKLQQPFGDDAMPRAQAFRRYKMFSEAEPLLKMSSAADGHQQYSMDKRTCSIQYKINSQNGC